MVGDKSVLLSENVLDTSVIIRQNVSVFVFHTEVM